MRKFMIAGLAAAALASGVGTAVAQPVDPGRYGQWDDNWGAQPPPPPAKMRYWRDHEREQNWYNHVHSCTTRFHNYDARRDKYREGRRWIVCRD
jgi:hypothetical protein